MSKIKLGILAILILSLTILLHIIPKDEPAVMEGSIAATPEPIVEAIEHEPVILVEEPAEQEVEEQEEEEQEVEEQEEEELAEQEEEEQEEEEQEEEEQEEEEQEENGPEIYNVPLDAALQRYTYNLCVDYEIEEYYPLVLAVMWHESEFVPTIISKTNDYGLMQINKVNHKWLSDKLGITDFLDEEQNIHAGVFMLSLYLHKYEDIDKALMAYNIGENGAKKRWAAGTYTTKYTRTTRERLELILSGEGYQK